MEQVFRYVMLVLETRSIYHQRDESIRGHVFYSFLALMLKKELNMRLKNHDVFKAVGVVLPPTIR